MVAAIRGLALSCHPLPTLAVTGITAGLSSMADNTGARAALLVLAVFTGQLSIGWSNDWIDSARDRASQRSDKPAALGQVKVSTVAAAGWTALVATIAASIALGPRAGFAAALVVVCGWAYNLGLKASWASWLPYAIAFGALPAAATLNGSTSRGGTAHTSSSPAGSHWPGAWAVAAGAMLGVAAHLANVLPDLADDAATGVRGLPHRLGARTTSVVGPALLVLATGVIEFGPAGRTSLGGWAAMLGSAAVGLAAIRLAAADAKAGRTLDRRYFLAVVGVAALDLVLFGVSGGRLS